jgi:hypothetical protein
VQRGEVEEFHALWGGVERTGLGTAREFSEAQGPYPRKVPTRLLALFTEIAVCDGRGRTWTQLWPFRAALALLKGEKTCSARWAGPRF